MERRLAAVLSADVVGYTAMMARDEAGTLEQLEATRGMICGQVPQHGGRVVDAVGDNILAEFSSAVDALHCALEIQRHLASRDDDSDEDGMRYRIGINVGDLVVIGERIAGDGVNVAARIQAEAEPGGIAISHAVLEQVEGKLKFQAHDRGEFTLKNVPRPVHIYAIEGVDSETGGRPDKPVSTHVPGFGGQSAIAVLPFRNLSGDPDQEYFAEGLAEDLIRLLAGLRLYPVISRNSSFSYRDSNTDARKIGRALGAHYIVTGSVRRAGDRLRVTAELADSGDGRQLWSSRYDREMRDVFDVQDEITAAIAGAVGPALTESEMLHAIRRKPQDLDAWECVHRGMWHLFRYTQEGLQKARVWALRALEIDPEEVAAHSLVAFSRMYEVVYHWVADRDEPLAEAMQAAERAYTIDQDNPFALTALGFACSLTGEQDRAIAILRRAAELNPSSALACWSLGSALAADGRPDEAIPMVEKAMRLSPQDTMTHEFLFTIASAHFIAGRDSDALELARQSLQRKPDQPGAWRVVAAASALLGKAEEAREAVGEIMRLTPNLSEQRLRVFLSDHSAERYLEGLRKAGWGG